MALCARLHLTAKRTWTPTPHASEVAQKFSVRGWKEVNLKYRVIEQFQEKYLIGAIGHVMEVSRSRYYAWRKLQNKELKAQWLHDWGKAAR